MKALLQNLNKTPGVLGSAYLDAETTVCDIGEALGGADALPLAKRAASACQMWLDARPGAPLETVVFVGESGRVVARPAGSGMLVAFAENDASAGVLRLKLRKTAEQIADAGRQAPGKAGETR